MVKLECQKYFTRIGRYTTLEIQDYQSIIVGILISLFLNICIMVLTKCYCFNQV